MPFFWLPTNDNELISTSKIITFLPVSLPIEKNALLSNPIPYPECLYLSILVFFVNLTDPNKQFNLHL